MKTRQGRLVGKPLIKSRVTDYCYAIPLHQGTGKVQ